MVNIVRGLISLILGITFCVMQATNNFGNGRSNGYLIGGILIVFGIYRLYRGIVQRQG
jgi:hypothetical protein